MIVLFFTKKVFIAIGVIVDMVVGRRLHQLKLHIPSQTLEVLKTSKVYLIPSMEVGGFKKWLRKLV